MNERKSEIDEDKGRVDLNESSPLVLTFTARPEFDATRKKKKKKAKKKKRKGRLIESSGKQESCLGMMLPGKIIQVKETGR